MNDVALCPHCGQPLATGFATGTRSLSPDPSVRTWDSPLDADGELGYAVIQRLARGETDQAIADALDVTLSQVEGMRPFVHTAANIKVGELR